MTVHGLPIEQRFWLKVFGTHDEDGCWHWMGAISKRYGKFFLGRDERGITRVTYAHRFSWELRNGPIPDGMEIDHLCENTLCQNPRHFELVTPEENKRREGARRRARREQELVAA
jgi:hypothetical protein